MSFITKRERVFKEFSEPVDLPARNEGKLKAYSSCTDARAWSHFTSDKTEHLVEIIKRNNEICRGKYVPVNVLIEMMTSTQKAEIQRLKRKINSLEQMLVAYDQLELSCDQKCEISNAHAMIKAANKSLDELPPLELDLSGFTEGIDSDGFQTGKSGGDDGSMGVKGIEWFSSSSGHTEKEKEKEKSSDKEKEKSSDKEKEKSSGEQGIEAKISKASKIIQSEVAKNCVCDVSTSAKDNRVEELQEVLISKDAKLSAMQNTIAVMENDVCEPYCLYAHIYTALEKIYGTLRQNEKYRLFLDLMSAGKDTRCLDIKGKILFKLKVLEKFSIALLSPCSERFKFDETCECYTAQIQVGTNYTFPQSTDHQYPPDVIRSKLIADIMENDEMKDIIIKENQTKSDDRSYDVLVADNYSIDTENLSRLKALQIDYDDLMNSYEDIKHERDTLKIKCKHYEDLEEELEDCRTKLREYNLLYNEREHYRKRSEDLDSLKEQYIVLHDETSNLETQLKAEIEINHMKTVSIDELRHDNISLENKLSELSIAFEKERNSVLCKLKEAECKIMCQDQQIKSLLAQIDKILEQDHGKKQDPMDSAAMIDEVEAMRDQVKRLNDALYSSEDEKQQLHEQFEDNLKLINELKFEIEEWKSNCEKTLQRNEYLEKYTEEFRDEVRRLVEENRLLSQEVQEKTTAVGNLMGVINNKSQDVNRLMNEIESKKKENKELMKRLQDTKDKYEGSMSESENEKKQVLKSLQLAKQESKELLDRVKDYDTLLHRSEDISKSLVKETESCNELRKMLMNTVEENKKLQLDLSSQEHNNSILLQEIQRLREINNYAVDNINTLQSDKNQYRQSLELTKKESELLEYKLREYEALRDQLQDLRQSHEKLLNDKNKLEIELRSKTREIDEALDSVELTKKKSEQLLMKKINESENLKEDMIKLNKDYRKLVNEKEALLKDLIDKNKEFDELSHSLSELQAENKALSQEFAELKKTYDDLVNEKTTLQCDLNTKTSEMNNLCNALEDKIEENRDLIGQIKAIEKDHIESVGKLTDINLKTQTTLHSLRRESEELINKLKNYETLLKEYDELKIANNQLKLEMGKLEVDLGKQLTELKKLEEEKDNWKKQAEIAMTQNETLEETITNVRHELIQSTSNSPYRQVVKEIEDMKKEKLAHNRRIKELLDKLDEAENNISNLSEDILARDDRIAILQNHINALEEEVRQLQNDLAEVVNAGEQLKENSDKKLDQTLNKMEAHHSKATHNMKIELAKIQNEKTILEEKLSVTQIKSDESFRDNHKYMSQIIHLQNEREIIVTDIKQLELTCVGDSILSPTSCSVDEVLASLEKIRKAIDARNHKSSSLEKTLLNVQTSSQLLVSKADEAKRLVEKEKLKIINEKEEAIADKLNMEKQLLDLKLQLEQQTVHDKGIIKDLEAEILNQKLIIDKVNDSTQSYISKLEEEMQNLQKLYKNAIKKVNELQEKSKNTSEENDKKNKLLEKVNKKLTEKSKEVSVLRKELDKLKNKPMNDIDVQVGSSSRRNIKSQTDKVLSSDSEIGITSSLYEMKGKENEHNINTLKVNTAPRSKTPDPKPRDVVQPINDVQIMSVNVEPTLDYVKSSYIDYKIKRLGPKKVDHFSIANENAEERADNSNVEPNTSDIYNELSDMQMNSSKAMKQDDKSTNDPAVQDPQTLKSGNDFSNLVATLKEEETYAKPGTSYDNKLFLIYQDSESVQADNNSNSFRQKPIHSRQRTILVETLTMQPDRETKNGNQSENKTDRPKTKLDVKMPIIPPTTQISIETISTYEAESKENNEQEVKLDLFTTIDDVLDEGLLKVEANIPLNEYISDGIEKFQSPENFGLEYILHSINDEINPGNIAESSMGLHRSRSDDLYQLLKGSSQGNPIIQSPINAISSTGKTTTMSLPSQTKWSENNKTKSTVEKGILAEIGAPDDYESRIRHISQQLENTERDCKKKMEAIKAQYDSNIKSIINEHNLGVKSIQNLHEETLQDIIKIHENETESLRSMSIEAMRKVDKLERENKILKSKILECTCGCVHLDEGPVKKVCTDLKKRRSKCRGDTSMLSKTNIEAFNVKPKLRVNGPCTCSLDVNISDTIRNIFEQVDVEQRKLAEHAYLKYIANKIITMSVESLDIHELSFLHLKVCRTWKNKLAREEALQKKIETLESQLINKQRFTQQHIAELDRKVAEEHRRLQVMREAVCCGADSSDCYPSIANETLQHRISDVDTATGPSNTEIFRNEIPTCNSDYCLEVKEQHSAGDITPGLSGTGLKLKPPKSRGESRAVLAKLDFEDRKAEESRLEERRGERRMKKLYDEPPTRLRRSHERQRSRK